MLPKTPIKVLVIGGGGREHALCWKLAQSQLVEFIYCATGNGGTATLAKTENVAIDINDFEALSQFALDKKIELTVVGPDNPLADGIVDVFEKMGLRIFGPTRQAARLEWSKAYAKEFMQSIGLPTARFVICDSYSAGEKSIRENDWARVVKVDGLALGKGVFVCDSQDEALAALQEIFEEKRFGSSGNIVVLEEKLAGEEISLLCFCDGKKLVALPPCQDYKRRFDGDSGPNTGGMGAYSPVALYDLCCDEIQEQVLRPLEQALADGHLSYKGLLYVGLMIAESKDAVSGKIIYNPYILEFNARFGDPETQTLLPRLTSDLLPILWACTEGSISSVAINWSKQASVCVVATADSYPQSSSKGQSITLRETDHNVVIFHAGTALVGGQLQTAGGRVICVTGLAPSIEAAAERAYTGLKTISFAGMSYRTDIARRAIKQCLSS